MVEVNNLRSLGDEILCVINLIKPWLDLIMLFFYSTFY